MKPFLLGILILGLSLICHPAIAEEMPLIDGDLGNGGFEIGTMKGWMANQDLVESPEKIEASEKAGEYAFHVKMMGKPGGRVVSSLIKNLDNVVPENGRTFVLKFDTKEMPDLSAPRWTVEVLLFTAGGVSQTLLFRNEAENMDDEEWTTHEMLSTSTINEDWQGGKIQLRIIFFQDDGRENEFYELLLDNVQLLQTE